jgi:hypothetical protein
MTNKQKSKTPGLKTWRLAFYKTVCEVLCKGGGTPFDCAEEHSTQG